MTDTPFSWSAFLGGAALSDGAVLLLPPGRLALADSDVLTINAHRVTIRGQGTVLVKPTKSNFFTVGAVQQTRFEDFGIEVTNPAPAGAGDPAVAFNLAGSVRTRITGVNFHNVVNFALLSSNCLITRITENEGEIANKGGSFVQINQANGTIVSDNDVIQIETGGPEANNAISGAAVMIFNGDTYQINNNLFQRFYWGILANAVAGTVVQNFWMSGNIIDACRKQGVYLIASGGFVTRGWIRDTWVTSFEETGFDILRAAGTLDQIQFHAPRTVRNAGHGMSVSGAVKAIDVYAPMLKTVGAGKAGLLVSGLTSSFDLRVFDGELGTTDPMLPTYAADYGVKTTSGSVPQITGTRLQGTVAPQYP